MQQIHLAHFQSCDTSIAITKTNWPYMPPVGASCLPLVSTNYPRSWNPGPQGWTRMKLWRGPAWCGMLLKPGINVLNTNVCIIDSCKAFDTYNTKTNEQMCHDTHVNRHMTYHNLRSNKHQAFHSQVLHHRFLKTNESHLLRHLVHLEYRACPCATSAWMFQSRPSRSSQWCIFWEKKAVSPWFLEVWGYISVKQNHQFGNYWNFWSNVPGPNTPKLDLADGSNSQGIWRFYLFH